MLDLYKLTGDSLNCSRPRDEVAAVRIAKSVLEEAYVDLKDRRAVVADEAARFFTSGEYQVYADIADVEYETVLAGCAGVIANGLPIVDGRQERYAGGVKR